MLVDMGPLRPLSEVGIIFGDGIFAGEGLLKVLNIKSTCKICLDVFHLTSDTDGAWPKEFGKAWPKRCTRILGIVAGSSRASSTQS